MKGALVCAKGASSVAEEDRWAKLEEIIRRVVREEIQVLQKPVRTKVGFKNGMFTGLGEIEMAALEAAYPAVSIMSEIKQAAAWIVTHPNDAPRSNFGAFLNSWLRKHQDRHSLRSIPTERPTEVRVRLCGYCGRGSVGTVNGIPHCDEHATDAMDMKPRRMLGVVAKPVAGRD